ncbi:MAG: hypothetical protein ACP5TY_06640 [Thermodesulforhabdaceae bacterium]
MSLRMECMCCECGISHYIPLEDITSTEVTGGFQYPIVLNIVCSECGGTLFIVGKEGDQPRYVVG